jgi:hypothetical protein
MGGGVAGHDATLKPISNTQSPLTRRSDVLRIVMSLNSEAALGKKAVIASEAKQSIFVAKKNWIASSRSLSSGAHSRDPLASRNDVAWSRYSFTISRRDTPEL